MPDFFFLLGGRGGGWVGLELIVPLFSMEVGKGIALFHMISRTLVLHEIHVSNSKQEQNILVYYKLNPLSIS